MVLLKLQLSGQAGAEGRCEASGLNRLQNYINVEALILRMGFGVYYTRTRIRTLKKYR